MARQPMTPEEKKAFGEKMKAARLAKSQNPPQGNGTPPQPASTQEDPQVKAKLAELDIAIERANKAAEAMEAQSKKQGEFSSGRQATPEEIQTAEKQFLSKRQIMKEKLAAQPKVRIFIPLEGKEKLGAQHPVTLNGYRLNVPKGVYVDVPEQVADIIKDSFNQTEEAISNNPRRIDADSEKAAVLSR